MLRSLDDFVNEDSIRDGCYSALLATVPSLHETERSFHLKDPYFPCYRALTDVNKKIIIFNKIFPRCILPVICLVNKFTSADANNSSLENNSDSAYRSTYPKNSERLVYSSPLNLIFHWLNAGIGFFIPIVRQENHKRLLTFAIKFSKQIYEVLKCKLWRHPMCERNNQINFDCELVQWLSLLN